MNKLSTNNHYADLDSLIHISEQWNLVLSEMNSLCEDLATLPLDLATLKQHQSDLLTNRHSDRTISFSNQLSDAEVENIVDYLAQASSKLIKLNNHSKNIIALNERIEAIQTNKNLYSLEFDNEIVHFGNSFATLKAEKIGLKPINRIKAFKRQYPENFWSIVIAFCLIIFSGYILTLNSPAKTASSVNHIENYK